MPHVIVEYSANVDESHDMAAFAKALAEAASETGVFPLGGLRVRLYPSEHYVVADAHPANGFVSLLLRIGAGRDLETKQRAGQLIFDAASAFLADTLAGEHFMLSLDIQENDPEVSFKANSVHARLKRDREA